MKIKNTEIRVPILNNEYRILVCWGSDKYVAFLLKDYQYPQADWCEVQKIHEDFYSLRGITYSFVRCHPIIRLANPPTSPEMIGTLAHEAIHAVSAIFENIHQIERAEEIMAHSVGAVVRTTLNHVKNNATKKSTKKKK